MFDIYRKMDNIVPKLTTKQGAVAMTEKNDLNDMMVFLAVVENGGFTLAAERLHIPKANVSRKVSRLEQQLGVVLLERTTRSQHLTEAGKIYLSHCRRIHEELDLATASISDILGSLRGQLRIGASVTIGQQIIRPALGQFMLDYPDIKMQLNLVNRRIDLIEEGFDMLIRVGQLADSRLIGKKLARARRKIYAAPNYLKRCSKLESPDDLQHCDFLLMSSVHSDGKLLLETVEQRRQLSLTPRLVVDDYAILRQAVVEGVGIAILPEYMCQEEVKSGQLVNILPPWGMSDVDIYALYPKHRVNIPKVRAFLDYIIEVFAKRLDY